MSLFLTQAAMNFALERQNRRKRSIQPDKTLVALELPLSMMVNSQYILIATAGMHTVVYKHAHLGNTPIQLRLFVACSYEIVT